jgi:hypothetical protein
MQGELDILKAKLALGAEYAAIVRAEEAEKRAEAAEAERDACSDLVASLNDGCLSAEKRAEAAEAALAALRYESGWVCDTLLSGDTGRVEDAIRYAADCRQAIADTVPAAEAYRARVRREALREAADRLEAGIDPESLTAHALASPKWLRAMADEENKQ